MSIQAVLGAGGGDASSALAASERVEHLQTLIAQVERGPAGFAAELAAAQTGPTGASSETSPGTVLASDPANGQNTAAPATDESDYQLTTAAGAGAGAGADEVSGAAGSNASYVPLIEQAAARNGLEPAVLYGLIQQESGFDPNATSSAGALGLTQLMPGTASSLGVTEPLNPAQSIEGGARYLGQMLRQFGGNVTDALAGYNAGPGAVESFGGVPPYSETQQYVAKVLENAAAYRASASQDPTYATSGPDADVTATETST